MDWYSRRLLSWELSNALDTGFCVQALEAAGEPPSILNADQGSQYTSEEWSEAVEGRGIKMSMNGRRRWIDNVMVERLFGTIKYEEVYLFAYADGHEAQLGIAKSMVQYNTERPDQNLSHWCTGEVYRSLDKDTNSHRVKCL